MKTTLPGLRTLTASCAVLISALAAGPAFSADPPPWMNIIVGGPVPSAAETAKQDVLALNTAMFALYGESAKIISANILAQHPVILALFSGSGGRLMLYRPGMPRLEAPPVPEVYQLLK
ncbi:MAG: hypothetical protein B7Z45_06845, partial [Azorhizobium sp. 12-66-6]